VTGCPRCGAEVRPADEECWRCDSSLATDDGRAEPGTETDPDGRGSATTRHRGADQRARDDGTVEGPRRHGSDDRPAPEQGHGDPESGNGDASDGHTGADYGRHRTVPAHEQVRRSQGTTPGKPDRRPAQSRDAGPSRVRLPRISP